MVIVFAGGHISGGHYNPAVSTGVLVRGRMTANEYRGYVLTQVVAAIIGGLLVRIVGGHETAAAVDGAGRMLIAEFMFTFALVWVVLNVATARGTEGNSFYGLAIGFTVLAGAFAVGGISGGAFNPAIAIGLMVTGLLKWSNIWIYLLAELLAGVAAGWVFLYLLPGEKAAGDTEPAATS
jgi:aquaporin Z